MPPRWLQGASEGWSVGRSEVCSHSSPAGRSPHFRLVVHSQSIARSGLRTRLSRVWLTGHASCTAGAPPCPLAAAWLQDNVLEDNFRFVKFKPVQRGSDGMTTTKNLNCCCCCCCCCFAYYLPPCHKTAREGNREKICCAAVGLIGICSVLVMCSLGQLVNRYLGTACMSSGI